MSLQQEIRQLKKELAHLKEAFQVLESPPKRYGPKAGEIPILDYLKLELSAAREDKERQKLLEISRQALTDAEQRLALKEQKLTQLEVDCAAIASEMQAAGEAVISTESAYRQALTNFETLAAKYQRRWQELKPGQELYRRLGTVQFPGFVVTGCCGTLTTDALARDLR